MMQSREIRLKARPQGIPISDNFELQTVSVPEPQQGEVYVRNLWMSVDPYMRGRMNDVKSYVPPFEIGAVLEGGAIGEVVKSNDPSLKAGDLVFSMLGWREAFTCAAWNLRKLDTMGLPPQAFLGVMGMPGLTAWVGLLKIGALQKNDVVFVSAAAGAVGQVVVQIAKIKGCKVIGSAGSDEKCTYLKQIGCDETINYKTQKDLSAALAKAAPEGIDVYFDNVGADHLEAALENARPFARIVICGMISQYNTQGDMAGIKKPALILIKSLRIEGFIVSNHFEEIPQFEKEMSEWIKEKRMFWKETVEQGIEKAPKAFLNLFRGENLGKMLVKF